MTAIEKKHDKRIKALALRPKLIGLENVIASATEVNFFRPDGTLMRQPDVVFIQPRGVITIGEYHCTENHRSRAIHQLRDEYGFTEERFSISPELKYIWSNYMWENISPE